jgi:hypothetical protein
MNGTSLNGINLEGFTLTSRTQEKDEGAEDALGPGCQEGPCLRNGTQLNGIAVDGLASGRARMQEPEEDELWNCQSDGICPKNGTELDGIARRDTRFAWVDESDDEALGGLCQAEGICPKNGTELDGIARRAALEGLRMRQPQDDSGDASEVNDSRPPVNPTPPTGSVPSARDMLLQIQASPGGAQLLREAEQRSAPIQNAMADTSTACEPPDCLQATPYRPGIGSWGNYGFQIWGQNTTWTGQSSSFWLTAPGLGTPPRFQQGTPLLVAQSYDNRSGGWHIVTVELCKANHDGRFYTGPAVGRLFHGADSMYPRRKLPSDATLLNTWQLTIGDTPSVGCHLFPTLVELARGEHAFVFELETGDLLVQRVSLRRL